ncbi:hypothetical protein BGZ47_006646 [Haplosporangium gracile]|nr:hypothetical protein BGZ47_006646 [Haplosporangium gracile]
MHLDSYDSLNSSGEGETVGTAPEAHSSDSTELDGMITPKEYDETQKKDTNNASDEADWIAVGDDGVSWLLRNHPLLAQRPQSPTTQSSPPNMLLPEKGFTDRDAVDLIFFWRGHPYAFTMALHMFEKLSLLLDDRVQRLWEELSKKEANLVKDLRMELKAEALEWLVVSEAELMMD